MKPDIDLEVNVIIADDHKFFRDGLQLAMRRIHAVKKVTHAENGKEVLSILKTDFHDIVFMDVKMPVMGGIETTKKISSTFPEVKVIALSMYDDHKNVIDMFNNGAVGYIIKNTEKKEIEKAIYEVMEGRNYFSASVSNELFQTLLKKKTENLSNDKLKILSGREEQILRLICTELSNREIADKLHLSEKTVETHRADLFSKTGARNVAGLVKYAIKNGYCDDL